MAPDLVPLIARVPEDVLGICRRLREKGKRGWIVGGCVRDLLRGGHRARTGTSRTDARPDEVMAIFRKVIPTGLQHGTVTRGASAASTTRSRRCAARARTPTGGGPDKVEFVDDITADPRAARLHDQRHRARPGGRAPHRSVRRPRRPRRAGASAPSATPPSASPRTACACCARRASRRRWSAPSIPTPSARWARAIARHLPQGERRARARRVDQGHEGAPARAWRSRPCARTAILGDHLPRARWSRWAASRTSGTPSTCGATRMACLDACKPATRSCASRRCSTTSASRARGRSRTRRRTTRSTSTSASARRWPSRSCARLKLLERRARAGGRARSPPPHLLRGRLDRRRRAPLDPPHHARARAGSRTSSASPTRAARARRPEDLASIEQLRARVEAMLAAGAASRRRIWR